MSRVQLTAVLATALLAAGAAHAAESYQLDEAHSHVGFSVRHFGLSKVRGAFQDFSADLTVDEENLAQSSVVFRIDTASIDTDNEDRDNHLRSADFLDVENNPQITFASKRIEQTADGYVAVGDLTIRGVTKEIQLPVSVAGPLKDPMGNHRLGIEGEITINRQDYGVSWNRVLDTGGLVVADDVEIEFALEATRPLEEATASQ